MLEEVRIRRPTVDGTATAPNGVQTCDHSWCELNLGGVTCVNMEPVEGQDSVWGHQTPGWNQLWSPNGGEDGIPDPHTPGWIWSWSPNGEHDSFSNHCKERTIGSHCPLPLVGLGQPSGRSQAVSTDQAEGVRDDAGWRRRAQGSRDGARRRWSLLVPMCSYGQGSIRAASGTTLGPPGT